MSLKAFHLFFIGLSILLSVWLGVWGVGTYFAGAGGGRLAFGVVFFLAAVVLVPYGLRVRRKLRDLGEEE